MDINKDYGEVPEDFRDLRPHLTEDELREAHNQFMAYIELVIQIVDRIENNPVEYAKFKRLLAEDKRRRGEIE